jgi:hypothetical protein
MEILLSIAPRDCDLPDNVRFLITSRPEPWADISGSKKTSRACGVQTACPRDRIICECRDDWPNTEQLAELSGKANDLFHHAATALQWIKQQIDDHNSWRLSGYKVKAPIASTPSLRILAGPEIFLQRWLVVSFHVVSKRYY